MTASRGVAGAALVLTLFSCSEETAPEPVVLPVVVVDDRVFSVADLATYLMANLDEAPAGEAPPAAAMNRIKSRLFDNFVDEAIQLVHAERLGVTVTNEEIDSYLGDTGGPSDEQEALEPRKREATRRALMVQKLREQYAREHSGVSDAEIVARLAELEERGPKLLTLRTLRTLSREEALKVRREILRGKVSFEDAANSYGIGSDGGLPMDVVPESLPAEVRRVVERLRPGHLSVPVEFRGSHYLFALKPAAGDEPDDSPWMRARMELLEQRYLEASERLLERIREQSEVRLYVENLPFPYVPEP